MTGGRPRIISPLAPSLLTAALVFSGCSSDMPRGADSVFTLFAPPSPAQAAEWATDRYDAGKRYKGTLLLSRASFGGDPVYLDLYHRYLTDSDPSVRAAACRALALHGTPDQVPLLVERLKDEDPLTRAEAARALQRLHNPAAVEGLIRIIDPEVEPEPEVRAEAADALGQYAQPRVLDALIAALDDPSLAVNGRTLASLRTLTGQDYGFDRSAWVRWADKNKQPFAAGRAYVYPTYQRSRTFVEYLPFVPDPPNEKPALPVGMPRAFETQPALPASVDPTKGR